MRILECVNLSRSYGKGEALVHALNMINLSINERELIFITGPSGSGKSTLLHLLGGLDTPTSGRILFSKQDIQALTENERAILRRKHFGFVFQDFQLIPVLNALDNIRMPALLNNEDIDPVWLEMLIQKLGIKDRLKHLPNALSGGQQQLVAIARAMIMRPQVIFADEPTGNLDSESGHNALSLLIETAHATGCTLVVVTHDTKAVSSASRQIVLVDGRIVEDICDEAILDAGIS